MKKLLTCMLTFCMVITLAACNSPVSTAKPADSTAPTTPSTNASQSSDGGTSSPAENPPYMLAEGKTLKIGWSCHEWSPYNTALDEYIHRTIDKLSGGRAEIITVSADGDALKQLADVEDLITHDVDVIIIKAQDETTCANALGEAREKGIKVIVLQRRMLTENYDFFFGPLMDGVAKEMAEACLKKFPNGNFNYCFLEGNATGANDLELVAVLEQAFKDSELPGIVKLDGQTCANSRALSKQITEDWITAHGEKIDLIICANDELRIGAEQAIAESGINKMIYTTGINAVTEAIDSVKDGQCIYTAAGNPGVFPACEIMIAIANGTADKYSREIGIGLTGITPDNIMQHYDQVKASNLYMLGLLPPAQNPLYVSLAEKGYPEFMELIHD